MKSKVTYLKAHFGRSTEQEQEEILEKYRLIRNPTNHKDPEKWLQEYKEIVAHCKRLGIPDVSNVLAIKDFLNAAERFLPDVVKPWKSTRRLPRQPNITLDEYFISFAESVTDHKLANPGRKGAFATATTSSSDASSSSASKTNKKDCPCGRKHPWEPRTCAAVIWALTGIWTRPGNTHMGQEKRRQIRDTLKANKHAATVEAVESKYGNRSNDNTKSPKGDKGEEGVKKLGSINMTVRINTSDDDDSDAEGFTLKEAAPKDGESNAPRGQIDAPNAWDEEDLDDKGFILKLAGPSSDETEELPPPDDETLRGALVVGIIEGAEYEQKADESATSVAFSSATFPLRDSVVIDSAASVNVGNDHKRFTNLKDCYAEIYAGEQVLVARKIGTMTIRFKGAKDQIMEFEAHNSYYLPRFHTTVISEARLRKAGFWVSGWDDTLYRGPPLKREVICVLTKKYGIRVMEYHSLSSCIVLPRSSAGVIARPWVFATTKFTRKRRPRQDPRPPRTDSMDLWHLRTGHLNEHALNKLAEEARGVQIAPKGSISKQDCVSCRISEARRVISKRTQERPFRPFAVVSVDIFDVGNAYNGHRYAFVFKEWYTGLPDVATTSTKTVASSLVKNYCTRTERHYGIAVLKIMLDSESTLISLEGQRPREFESWAQAEGIDLQIAPIATKEPNGGVERQGGVILQKARTMLIAANLPDDLWPEAVHAATYLLKRSPSRARNYKAPETVLKEWLIEKEKSDWPKDTETRPDWSGMHAYGCRAYPLERDYQHGRDVRWFKTHARAHIGYLVGYRASNIYRIWIPRLGEVITTRDVTFDERLFYRGSDEENKLDISESEYHEIVRAISSPPAAQGEPSDDDALSERPEAQNPRQTNHPAADPQPEPQTEEPEEQIQDTIYVRLPEEAVQLRTPDPTPERDVAQEREEDTHGASHQGVKDSRVPPPSVERHAERAVQSPDVERYDEGSSGHDAPSVGRYAKGQPASGTGAQTETDHLPSVPQTDGVRDQVEGRKTTRARRHWEQPPEELILKGKRTRRQTEKAKNASAFEVIAMDSTYESVARTAETIPLFATMIVFSTLLSAAFSTPAEKQGHPPEPTSWRELESHPFGDQFKEDARREMDKFKEKGVYKEVGRQKARGRILPMKWVFKYKFDSNGRLTKCKSRLVVRGDLQEETWEETRAATLAARTFRTMMAIMAAFDLNAAQFDVTNAFLHAGLPDPEATFCEIPPGFKDGKEGLIWRLLKAVYGLRRAPKLWHDEITKALKTWGFEANSEDPCLLRKGRIYLFFFVDDFIILYPNGGEEDFEALKKYLFERFEIREEGPVDWFLAIRVIRDRAKRMVYLCQYAYIEKIARKFELDGQAHKWPSIPIPCVEYAASKGQATEAEIRAYGTKVGSALYVAVMTRLDVAFAVALLSRYLLNPSQEHQKAIDQVIRYLYCTRYLALSYGGDELRLILASDASFADDPDTRFSSQGYIISLFGGPIDWKASRQSTVTTSTTEAELLALTTTAKEGVALKRLFRDIKLQTEDPLTIFCDNQQTIRLVVGENERINTKLKHVDIHNLWARQEYAKGSFEVEYLPTADMPADGMTKALNRQKFERFRSLLNFTDTSDFVRKENASPEGVPEAPEATENKN